MGAAMNAIVKLNRKPAYLLTSLAALDAFALEAQAVVDIRVRIGKSVDQEPHTLEQADRQIAALLDLEPCEQTINEVTRRLVDGLQPAATEQTRQEIALLVGAFPSGNVPDPAVYSPIMLREVIAIRPSVLALAAACNKLRRTCRWQPPIADVLQAIREEEALWRYRLRCVSEVSHEHAQALEKLEKARAWLARPDEQKKAERQERLDRLERLQPANQGRRCREEFGLEMASLLPKTGDVVGSLHLEFKECGRPRCRCRRGLLHGPYLYRHWREGGRQRKEYVPMKRLGDVLLEIECQRAAAIRPAEVALVLRELRDV
jgi:hypothetical protein